jgi:hypothetical protein
VGTVIAAMATDGFVTLRSAHENELDQLPQILKVKDIPLFCSNRSCPGAKRHLRARIIVPTYHRNADALSLSYIGNRAIGVT